MGFFDRVKSVVKTTVQTGAAATSPLLAQAGRTAAGTVAGRLAPRTTIRPPALSLNAPAPLDAASTDPGQTITGSQAAPSPIALALGVAAIGFIGYKYFSKRR